ncbi:MAG: hypothetical protein FJ146_16380, partial [Deltaproteobacteria bacterium]|nr:hypothetical protein [Deltaproteobacteria bacterium]
TVGTLRVTANSATVPAVRTDQSGAGPTALFMGGNVGIGTTAPNQKLSVSGVVESTSGGIKFPDATTQTTSASNGISSCPSGYTMIGTTGKRGTFCISTAERTAATWATAMQTCINLNLTEGSAFLCSYNQWYKACLAGTPTSMTNNWEWTSNITNNTNAMQAGNGSCGALSNASDFTTTSYTYRCCLE